MLDIHTLLHMGWYLRICIDCVEGFFLGYSAACFALHGQKFPLIGISFWLTWAMDSFQWMLLSGNECMHVQNVWGFLL